MKVLQYLLFVISFSVNAQQITTLKEPLKVNVSIHLNKIYDINSVNQTYILDAYLVLRWEDAKSNIFIEDDKGIVYENNKFPTDIFIPSFELINILGERKIINNQLIVLKNGQYIYNERFHGTFTTQMDYHKYPNDIQCFTIQLESFTMEREKLIFINPKLFPLQLTENYMEGWDIIEKKDYVNEVTYNHLSINRKGEVFSRCNFEIYAQRKIEYYLWKVFLPVGLLIIASWLVFWVKDFANQLSISFTLMLTMVTFNFYTSSLLPALPYNTFVEIVIISGYISIFLTLISIIFTHAYSSSEIVKRKFNRFFKIFFPLLYLLYISICVFVIFISK